MCNFLIVWLEQMTYKYNFCFIHAFQQLLAFFVLFYNVENEKLSLQRKIEQSEHMKLMPTPNSTVREVLDDTTYPYDIITLRFDRLIFFIRSKY